MGQRSLGTSGGATWVRMDPIEKRSGGGRGAADWGSWVVWMSHFYDFGRSFTQIQQHCSCFLGGCLNKGVLAHTQEDGRAGQVRQDPLPPPMKQEFECRGSQEGGSQSPGTLWGSDCTRQRPVLQLLAFTNSAENTPLSSSIPDRFCLP